LRASGFIGDAEDGMLDRKMLHPQSFGRTDMELEVIGRKVHVLESCHSTWIFDAERGLFRRIPRGADITMPSAGEWHAYYRLDVDDSTGAFAIALNPDGTRMLRSWVHEEPCLHCLVGDVTGELSLAPVDQAG
jgi:hypothetical protein